MRKISLTLFIVLSIAQPARASLQTDLEYEKLAYRLELVRNQIELTISNHGSMANDVRRQRRELEGTDVLVRIPMVSRDLKNDADLIESIRQDFARGASDHPGIHLKSVRFTSKWKVAPKRVPKEATFDLGYDIPEDQIADRRDVRIVADFDSPPPANPNSWLSRQQEYVRRLLWPKSAKIHGKRLVMDTRIFRFREFEYPKLLAPDLSRYPAMSVPDNQVQGTAAKRIARYRQEIVKMWPQAQPYIDDLRAFALNDVRMNFFLKHANIR